MPCRCLVTVCDALCDLVPFVQFKKREKHSWRSLTFSKVRDFTKSNTPAWVFFTFLKLYKWYQIAQRITYIQNLKNMLNEMYHDPVGKKCSIIKN